MSYTRDEYNYGAVWRATATNQEFAENAQRPDEWINAARPLRVGAYVLKAQHFQWVVTRCKGEADVSTCGLLFTSLFLASLSLEDVLKAVLLIRMPSLAQNGKLRFGNWGHDLIEIASQAHFQLQSDEADFLRVSCNPCIVSFGRYPMASSKSGAPGLWQLHTGAFRHFESVFMRAAETAIQEGRKGADRDRTGALNKLAVEIRNDVPPSIMFA